MRIHTRSLTPNDAPERSDPAEDAEHGANSAGDCRLTPGQRQFLEAVVNLGTTDTYALANRLSIAENTVREHFKQIGQRLGTHGRFETVLLALKHGWVTLPPPATRGFPRRAGPGSRGA
jgi:DNA-binding NarL/FixJ family response regulator